MASRLYKAYSFVEDHPDLGNVCFAWFYHLREKPVAPYQDLIEGYDELDETKKSRARRDVNELFTDQEVEVLTAHLENEHGIESFLIEKPVPVRLEDMDDEKVLRMEHDTPGAIYMFSREPGYNLPFEVWAYYHLRGSDEAENRDLLDIVSRGQEKITWLARHIFTTFRKLVTGLKFYILDCGCIYYQRRFMDGNLASKVGIYRDAEDDPCDICMSTGEKWKDRVVDEAIVYNSKFQVEL